MHSNLGHDNLFKRLVQVSICCSFLSSAYQFYTFSNSTFSWCFVELEQSEALCENIVAVQIWLLVFSALVVWIKKISLLSGLGSICLMLNVVAYMNHASDDQAYLSLFSNSLKALLPFVLVCLYFKRMDWGVMLARWLTAFVFIGHGMKALYDEPLYLDYLTHFFNLMNFNLLPATVLMLLHAIGTIDLALSHHLCFYKLIRIKWVLIYMISWGLITALARVIFSGMGAWHEVTVRAPHYLIPLALLWVLQQERKALRGN